MNDFGAIVAAASLAHDIEIHHLAILVKSNWRIFLCGNGKKIQGISLCKRVARFSDFEGNANGFTVLTGTRPGIRRGLLMLH
jgi:dGTPase